MCEIIQKKSQTLSFHFASFIQLPFNILHGKLETKLPSSGSTNLCKLSPFSVSSAAKIN